MSVTGKRTSAYIEYLRKVCNLSVTVHSIPGGVIEYLMSELAPYNIHSSGFCMYMKTNREIWDKCIYNQRKLIDKLNMTGDCHFGMCYLGVCEYVYPVRIKEKLEGFVCVSGYSSKAVGQQAEAIAKSKIKKACHDFGINPDETIRLYRDELSCNMPSREYVDTLIFPLVSMLIQMVTEYKSASDASYNGSGSYVYGHILTYLNINFKKNVKVEDLCKLCHCSASYISHLFPKLSGKSISEYVNELRINQAKVMLRNSEIPVKNIAFEVGFNDSNYFSSVFKRFTGISPRQYRTQTNSKAGT